MKITTIISIITLMVASDCHSQNKKKAVINNFIKEVILSESYDISTINKFINVNPDSLISTSTTYKQLKFHIELIRSQIIENDNEFKIVTYKEFKNTFKDYNLVYKNPNEIFCVVSEANLITPVIIDEHNKIISFYTGLIKFKNKINPFLYQ